MQLIVVKLNETPANIYKEPGKNITVYSYLDIKAISKGKYLNTKEFKFNKFKLIYLLKVNF